MCTQPLLTGRMTRARRMYSNAGTAAYPTLRLPLLRYAALLNGPNQDAEDPTSLLRSHMSSENTSPNSTVPLFRRREAVTKAEPDAELEVLARQFHNLKASIQHELAREPTEPPTTTFVPDEEEDAGEALPTKPFGSPAEYYEPALRPPPPLPEESAMDADWQRAPPFGGTLSEEVCDDLANSPSTTRHTRATDPVAARLRLRPRRPRRLSLRRRRWARRASRIRWAAKDSDTLPAAASPRALAFARAHIYRIAPISIECGRRWRSRLRRSSVRCATRCVGRRRRAACSECGWRRRLLVRASRARTTSKYAHTGGGGGFWLGTYGREWDHGAAVGPRLPWP